MTKPVIQLRLFGEIDYDVADDFFRQMHEAEEFGAIAPWEVSICSPGGQLEPGTAVYEELKARSLWGGGGHRVTTIARGECSSMATLVAQAGDRRLTGELTPWTFHRGRVGCLGNKPLDLARDEVNAAIDFDDALDKELLRRSEMSLASYRHQIDDGKDWTIMGYHVVQFGFADEIG